MIISVHDLCVWTRVGAGTTTRGPFPFRIKNIDEGSGKTIIEYLNGEMEGLTYWHKTSFIENNARPATRVWGAAVGNVYLNTVTAAECRITSLRYDPSTLDGQHRIVAEVLSNKGLSGTILFLRRGLWSPDNWTYLRHEEIEKTDAEVRIPVVGDVYLNNESKREHRVISIRPKPQAHNPTFASARTEIIGEPGKYGDFAFSARGLWKPDCWTYLRHEPPRCTWCGCTGVVATIECVRVEDGHRQSFRRCADHLKDCSASWRLAPEVVKVGDRRQDSDGNVWHVGNYVGERDPHNPDRFVCTCERGGIIEGRSIARQELEAMPLIAGKFEGLEEDKAPEPQVVSVVREHRCGIAGCDAALHRSSDPFACGWEQLGADSWVCRGCAKRRGQPSEPDKNQAYHDATKECPPDLNPKGWAAAVMALSEYREAHGADMYRVTCELAHMLRGETWTLFSEVVGQEAIATYGRAITPSPAKWSYNYRRGERRG